MKKNKNWFLALVLALLLFGCEPTKVVVTPDQVNTELAKAKSSYEALLAYNPPETMTYNYRKLITQAEQAKAKGDVDQAISFARQADEQATLTLQLLKDQMAKYRGQLDSSRSQIENLFPVNQNLIKKYWELESRFSKRDFQAMEEDLNAMLKLIDQEKRLSVVSEHTARVNAPQEYVKQWGDARIYQEITPDGKLKGVVDTVGNNARVKVIRVKLFAPDTTFYFVETDLRAQGWMAEKYLIGAEGNY